MCQPNSQPCEVGVIVIPISQAKQMGHSRAACPSYRVCKWERRAQTLCLTTNGPGQQDIEISEEI